MFAFTFSELWLFLFNIRRFPPFFIVIRPFCRLFTSERHKNGKNRMSLNGFYTSDHVYNGLYSKKFKP